MSLNLRISGDERSIAELKALAVRDRTYLKFLLEEARTNSDRTAQFTAPDGKVHRVRVKRRTGEVFAHPAIAAESAR